MKNIILDSKLSFLKNFNKTIVYSVAMVSIVGCGMKDTEVSMKFVEDESTPFLGSIGKIVLGCGQTYFIPGEYTRDGKSIKHDHSDAITIDVRREVEPDFIGDAMDLLKGFYDNFYTEIVSEYLPVSLFDEQFFSVINNKLVRGGKLRIIGGATKFKVVEKERVFFLSQMSESNAETRVPSYPDFVKRINESPSREWYGIDSEFDAEYNEFCNKVNNEYMNQSRCRRFCKIITSIITNCLCKKASFPLFEERVITESRKLFSDCMESLGFKVIEIKIENGLYNENDNSTKPQIILEKI